MPGLTMKDQVQDLRKEEATVIFEFWICLVKAVPAKAVCLYCSLTFISLASNIFPTPYLGFKELRKNRKVFGDAHKT